MQGAWPSERSALSVPYCIVHIILRKREKRRGLMHFFTFYFFFIFVFNEYCVLDIVSCESVFPSYVFCIIFFFSGNNFHKMVEFIFFHCFDLSIYWKIPSSEYFQMIHVCPQCNKTIILFEWHYHNDTY